jgi:hypothetical protein
VTNHHLVVKKFPTEASQAVPLGEFSSIRFSQPAAQQVPGLVSYGLSWQRFLTGQEDRLGVFTFNLEGHAYSEVAAVLANEWGVGVRTGCFCAHQYVAQLLGISKDDSQEARERMVTGLPVDLPGMACASLGLPTSRADIDRLVEGLQAIARGEVRATYTTSEHGDLKPVGADHAENSIVTPK